MGHQESLVKLINQGPPSRASGVKKSREEVLGRGGVCHTTTGRGLVAVVASIPDNPSPIWGGKKERHVLGAGRQHTLGEEETIFI